MHVAEVEEAASPRGGRARGAAHDDVVVVRVAVDHRRAAGRAARARPRPRSGRAPARRARAAAGRRRGRARPRIQRGAREVPLEVALRRPGARSRRGRRPSRRAGGPGCEQSPACAGAPRPASCPAASAASRRGAGAPSGPGATVTASPSRVGTTRGRGRWGARSSRCRRAAHCSSTSPRSRAGCIAFRTKSRPSGAARRKLSSNSPGQRPRRGLEAVAGPARRDRVLLGQGAVGAAVGLHRRIVLHFDCLVAATKALSEYGPPNGGRC